MKQSDQTVEYEKLDEFDRAIESLRGLPDIVEVSNTIDVSEPLTGRKATTFIVKRYRQSQVGDTLFLRIVEGEKATRVVLPPKVMKLLLRQDGVLSTKLRRQNGKRLAEDRKAQGIEPAFLKKAGER